MSCVVGCKCGLIPHCCGCCVGRGYSSDSDLTPSLGTSIRCGMALKIPKKKKKKKKKWYLRLKMQDQQACAAVQSCIFSIDTEKKSVAKNVKYSNFFLNYRNKLYSIFMSLLSQGRTFSVLNYALGLYRLG